MDYRKLGYYFIIIIAISLYISSNKMKPLKPSHREKKRYLLIEGKDANKKIIEDVILEFIGVLGFAKACPYFIKNEKSIILAVNRDYLDKIRASFLMSGKELKIIRVSGSIRKVK